MSFDLSDYVDVAEREHQLFERYPDARIQVDLVDTRNGAGELIAWAAKATIWRTPDDPVPVIDWAVEPVPGKTPYTKDSEAMNASTSAVGRAIVLAGFPSKKIASADEVRARHDDGAAGDIAAAQPAPSAAPSDNGNPADVIVPFGKHKGEKLGSIPQSYLEWIGDKYEPKTPEQRRIQAAALSLLGREQEAFGAPLSANDDDIPF